MTDLERYIIARWCYSIGESFLSDAEYRCVEEQIKKIQPQCEYLHRTWSNDPCPVELLKQYHMSHLIKKVEFLYQSESIPSIYNEEEYKRTYQYLNRETRVSYKIDGWNVQVNYYNGSCISANTRGRTGNNMDATVIMQIVPNKISVMGKVKVTGELSIPKDKWKQYQVITGNSSQRNSVSTAIARGDTSYLSFLAFHIQGDRDKLNSDRYKVLQELGFKTPICMYARDFYSLDKSIELLGKGWHFIPFLFL